MNTQNDGPAFGAWRKSSHSHPNNDCVEVAWRKSSRSNANGNQCVEVAVRSAVTGVRDSKNPGGAVLTLPQARWSGFLAALTR